MDLRELDKKLSQIQSELDIQETTLRNLQNTISGDNHPFEDELRKQEYQTHLRDYRESYDTLNQDYQESIEGLSESYLSMCPFYKGPSLPKPTYIDSKQDIADLYGLFLILGISQIYGL